MDGRHHADTIEPIPCFFTKRAGSEKNLSFQVNSMKTGQKVLVNTGFLSLGEVVTIATGVVWTAIIARYIGPVVYGTYGYLGSILAILVLFINFGFEFLTTRDVAKRPELGWSYLLTILGIKLIMSAIILGSFMAYVYWRGGDENIVGIAICMAIMTFLSALSSLNSSILYGREAMGYDTIAKVIRSFLALASAYICVQMRLNFPSILAVFVATSAFRLFLTTYFVIRVLRAFPLHRTYFKQMGTFFRDLLSRSIPFLGLMIVGVVYVNIPIILVKNLSLNPAEVGYYVAALRIFIILNIVPSMLFQAILPTFSRLYVENLEKMRRTFEFSYRFVILLAYPMAVGLWLVAPHVIHLIYGIDFEGGGRILQILALSLINGVGWIMSGALIAMDRQRIIVLISGLGLVLVSVIAWWSIPKWGAVAGAWAYNTGTLIGFVVYSVLTYRLLRIRYPFLWVIKVMLASALMGGMAWFLLQYINFLIVSFFISPAAYIGILILVRTFSPSDYMKLRQIAPDFIAKLLPLRHTAPSQH